MSIDEGISKHTQQEERGEEPPAQDYVDSGLAQAHLRWRVGRCRKWAAAAAFLAVGAAVALLGYSWSIWTAAALLIAAVVFVVSAWRKDPPLQKKRGQRLALDEATQRDLAVQYEQWKRLGDWMLGLGVVLIANGLLLLVLMFSYTSQLPVLLGVVQLGIGLFLCLSSWGTILAYHWVLPRGRH